MTILSSHDDKIMYVPVHALYPVAVKKNVFFPTYTKGGLGYDVEPLLSYAIVISKKSLKSVYDGIYSKVYIAERDEDGNKKPISITDTMSIIKASDANRCEGSCDVEENNNFRNDYISHAAIDSAKFLEDELQDDNEVLVIYMSETKLIKHGMQSKEKIVPFTFGKPVELKDPDHVPYTTTKFIYGADNENEPKNRWAVLQSSAAILQDMIEFTIISLSLHDTFETLQEFCKFLFSIKSKNFGDLDGSAPSTPVKDGCWMAMRLRVHQENVVDTAGSAYVPGLFDTATNPLCMVRVS